MLALAALALLAAGCGGSGSSESETEALKKLEAGAAKLTAARSFRVEVPVEAETEGESVEVACLDLSIDNHTKPERVDMVILGRTCAGGTEAEAHELIAIGRDAWASNGSGSWTAATITPSALDELEQEQTHLKALLAAAENVESEPKGGAVEEGEGNFVDVPSYSFEAPASAFPGTDEDLGDLEIEFEAVLDRKGFLREPVVHGDEGGTGATVTDKYNDVNEPLGIVPPDPSEVKGPKTKIRSKADLDRLFSVPSS